MSICAVLTGIRMTLVKNEQVIYIAYVLCFYAGIWWTGWEHHIYSEFSTSSWQITFVTLCPTSATSSSHSCLPWRRMSTSIETSVQMIPHGKPRLSCSRILCIEL